MTLDIRNKLKLKGQAGTVPATDPRAMFKKRTAEVLDRTYDDRSKRTKSTGMGRTIWDKDKLDAFGIDEFNCLKNGSYFIEALPLSFDPAVAYNRPLQVHFQVGFAGDHFICVHRYAGTKCYRCEIQAKLYREIPRVPGVKPPDHIKALYPNDRQGYLIWDRTAELLNGESPSTQISVWNMPKNKVHEEIQARVRDKITRATLDISDLTPGGDGRTIAFEVAMDGPFPNYKGFDLVLRQSPVTAEIAGKLAEIITAAQEAGFKTAIDYLLHIPTYDEVKTSMLTESEAGEPNAPDQPVDTPKDTPPTARPPSPAQQHVSDEERVTALVQKYEDMQSRLNGMNPIQWMLYLKGEGKEYAEAIAGLPKDVAIGQIVESLLEEECIKMGIKL